MSGILIVVLNTIVLIGALASAVIAVRAEKLLDSVIALGATGSFIALEFLLLQAPDVAIAEASVGAVLSTVLFIIAVQAGNSCINTVAELFGVLQDLAALLQLGILVNVQVGFGNFLDLVTKGLHSAELFTLVHCYSGDLTAKLAEIFKLFSILIADVLVITEGIQED